MSATEPEFNPDDFEGLRPAQVQIHAAELRKLRKAEKENQEYKARVEALERREAFARAGVPLDHPTADYLIRGYQGELTAEAIKAEAIRLGVITSPGATPQEIAGHQNAQAAANGAALPGQAPDYAAQLAELGKKTFAPSDDKGVQAHIQEIARLAKQAGAGFPINQ